jgi:hypothetical protein
VLLRTLIPLTGSSSWYFPRLPILSCIHRSKKLNINIYFTFFIPKVM